MRSSLVLTVLCDDRSGIVDQLSDIISNHDSLWVESRMASLAGKFAGLLHVDAPAAQVDALTAQLQALPDMVVQVTAQDPVTDLRETRLWAVSWVPPLR